MVLLRDGMMNRILIDIFWTTLITCSLLVIAIHNMELLLSVRLSVSVKKFAMEDLLCSGIKQYRYL